MMILDNLLGKLTVYDCGMTKTRIGPPYDGGYVAFKELCEETLTVFTFGIGNDVGFELDFAMRFPRVQRINLFDPTIEALPEDHPKFIHYKDNDAINDIPKHSLLKMDIEGGEWEGLLELYDRGQLQKFHQILIEIHLLHIFPRYGLTPYFAEVYQAFYDEINKRQFRLYHNVLTKLTRHFYLFHLHANNSLAMVNVQGKSFPPLLELSFVRKDLVKEVRETTGGFPVEGLDFPNKSDRKDIEGFYPWH